MTEGTEKAWGDELGLKGTFLKGTHIPDRF